LDVLPSSHLLAFTVTAFVLIAIPGPSVLERKTAARIVLDGFLVGVSNTKVIVFFAAMLPQFVDRQAGHVPVQIILLGAIFAGVALISDSTWAVAAGTVRAWLAASPRRLALLGGTGGLTMIGIGVGLAVTGRKD
jgi:threonine/homoserine/homoserine lactone efflux protein